MRDSGSQGGTVSFRWVGLRAGTLTMIVGLLGLIDVASLAFPLCPSAFAAPRLAPSEGVPLHPGIACSQESTLAEKARCRKVRTVEVAFLTLPDANGKPVDLEPDEIPRNFPIAHVAIRWRGEDAWLHAHPARGVQWSKSLERFGQVREVLESIALPSERYQEWIGRSYDPYFKWGDDAFYCSELVGKILSEVLPLQPIPMRFEGDYWERYFKQLGVPPTQGVGISPKAIYRAVHSSHYRPN